MSAAPGGVGLALRREVRRPGRPRTEGHDERLLAAVLELVDAGAPVTLRSVVERSGVSRAAIYRRWASLHDLVAEALDQGRTTPVISSSSVDPEEFIAAMLAEARAAVGATERIRARLVMGLQDPTLQRVYWEQHASRRRDPMRAAIEAGKRDGVFAADLDTEACCDLLSSIFYYQVVVRGERNMGAAAERVEAALRTVVAGMRVGVTGAPRPAAQPAPSGPR